MKEWNFILKDQRKNRVFWVAHQEWGNIITGFSEKQLSYLQIMDSIRIIIREDLQFCHFYKIQGKRQWKSLFFVKLTKKMLKEEEVKSQTKEILKLKKSKIHLLFIND